MVLAPRQIFPYFSIKHYPVQRCSIDWWNRFSPLRVQMTLGNDEGGRSSRKNCNGRGKLASIKFLRRRRLAAARSSLQVQNEAPLFPSAAPSSSSSSLNGKIVSGNNANASLRTIRNDTSLIEARGIRRGARKPVNYPRSRLAMEIRIKSRSEIISYSWWPARYIAGRWSLPSRPLSAPMMVKESWRCVLHSIVLIIGVRGGLLVENYFLVVLVVWWRTFCNVW